MTGPLFDPDVPVAGCYRVQLVKRGPFVGLRIYFGPPADPSTGEEMDRTPRWVASVNGQQVVDAMRFWPHCAREPISFADYLHLCRRARTMDPSDPYYDPTKPVDPSTAPPPF